MNHLMGDVARFGKGLCLSAALLLLPAAARAQEAPAPPPPAPPAAQETGVVIKRETKLVLVDAVVTDKKGKYVRDLTANDFNDFGTAIQEKLQLEIGGNPLPLPSAAGLGAGGLGLVGLCRRRLAT